MLKPHHFSYKCPLKISDLDRTEDGGHFCAKCSKDIHDLSDCSIEDVIELQRRKGSICGFVRAVSVTSVVSLAACSEDQNAVNQKGQGEVPPEPAVPEKFTPELMGDICIPEKEAPKPAPEKPAKDDDSTAKTDPLPEKPAKLDIDLKVRPMVMGIVCEPADLIPQEPEEPKALDPHREGSPG